MQQSTLADLALDIVNKLARASLHAARDTIDEALAALGEATDFDRTYLFRLRDGLFWDNTNEWVAPGVAPMIANLQGLPREMVAPWEDSLLREESVFISDVAGLSDDRGVERDFLQDQGIQSIFIVPVLENGELSGFLGYDAVRAPRRLTQAELRVLQSVSNGIGALSLRLNVEAALLESRDRQAAMLAAMPDMILQLDGDGILREMHAPPSMHTLKPAHDIIGQRLADFLPPDLASLSKEMRAEVAMGQAVTRRFKLPFMGKVRWYEARLGRGKLGDVFVIRDVTTEHLAEEQRTQHLQLLAGLFTTAPLGVVLMDRATGRFLDVNTAFASASGYSRDELLSIGVIDLMAPEFHAAAAEAIADLDKFGHYGPLPKEYIRKDGSRWPIITHGVAATDAEGRQVIWTYVEDLTEQRAREEEIRTGLVRAEAANRAKSAFLANMSHEIRTPMNGVLGMAELLSATPLNGKQREMLDVMRESGGVLLGILDDILDLARIEAGKLRMEPTSFSPTDLVRRAVALHSVTARSRGLGLRVTTDAGSETPLIGDPQRIGQILHNILGNAIKFSERGEVKLDMSCPQTGGLRIVVSDTGIGMDDAQVTRMFGRFEQADSSATRQYGGAGLGLSITRELLTLMNGTIDVRSVLGKGTTVSIDLPLRKAGAVLAATTQSKAVANCVPQGLKVLIAEDIATNQLILAALLRSLGASVTLTENGHQALDAFGKNQFDVLLFDVSMPKMNGIEALQAIQAQAKVHNSLMPKAIAVTASVMDAQILEYTASGFDGVLRKPFDLNNLVEALATVLA